MSLRQPVVDVCMCVFRDTRVEVDIAIFYRKDISSHMYSYIYMCMCIYIHTLL